ncbi:hypothetical protein [Oceaniglobus ichthyenteri]|uniref:hypothetical protein n=1 Tax=Oceaniglobus ichthyenteri TaxID=2136177 RepID=UPI000D379022|nr:hypothetical protein [Oceaniglobus ichthyenteri]
MSEYRLTTTRIFQGVWEGTLTRISGTGTPDVAVTHHDTPLDGVQMSGEAGQWRLFVPIPAGALSDGVQTFLIRDAGSDVQLGSFCIAMGDALEADIRAEMDLLRAELDMLKRAFRRHCVETA